MSSIEKKSLNQPDEGRSVENGQVDLVRLGGGATFTRLTLYPGWQWSQSVKPLVKTHSCQVHHVGTVASGQLHVEHEDGSSTDMGPGDAYVIEPGHDAWVVGSEPFVGYEFDSQAAQSYAQT